MGQAELQGFQGCPLSCTGRGGACWNPSTAPSEICLHHGKKQETWARPQNKSVVTNIHQSPDCWHAQWQAPASRFAVLPSLANVLQQSSLVEEVGEKFKISLLRCNFPFNPCFSVLGYAMQHFPPESGSSLGFCSSQPKKKRVRDSGALLLQRNLWRKRHLMKRQRYCRHTMYQPMPLWVSLDVSCQCLQLLPLVYWYLLLFQGSSSKADSLATLLSAKQADGASSVSSAASI